MTEFNLPLLRKAVDWAKSEASKPVADSEWYQDAYATSGKNIGRNCGTAYCIAGYVANLDGGHRIGTSMIDGSPEAVVARDLLGITDFDAWGDLENWGLFSAINTIEDVQEIAEVIARRYGEEL